jgi:hypothetical protein
MLPIMAWIVIMKRAGCRVNLHDVNPGELFDVTDEGTFRKPKRCAIAYLIKVSDNPWRVDLEAAEDHLHGT